MLTCKKPTIEHCHYTVMLFVLFSDGQQVIGFQCAGLRPDLAKDHWRGIEFYNATVTSYTDGPEQVSYSVSMSFLEYIDISYAGLDIFRGDGFYHGFATISASPYVPIMNNITITNGAYDALNLTDVKGDIHIANSSISDNRGECFLCMSTTYLHLS